MSNNAIVLHFRPPSPPQEKRPSWALVGDSGILTCRNFYQSGLSGDDFGLVRRLQLSAGLRGLGQFEAGEYGLGRVARGPAGVVVPHLDHPVLGRPAALPPEQRVQRVVLSVRRVMGPHVVTAVRRQHRFVAALLETEALCGRGSTRKRCRALGSPSSKNEFPRPAGGNGVPTCRFKGLPPYRIPYRTRTETTHFLRNRPRWYCPGYLLMIIISRVVTTAFLFFWQNHDSKWSWWRPLNGGKSPDIRSEFGGGGGQPRF